MTISSVKDFANASEEEVYDIMFDECVGDDDFYTDGGLLSADALVMFIQDNYEHYFEDCRVSEIANFVADYVNRGK